MEYHQIVKLKDGSECVLRNGTEQDSKAVLDVFVLTHEQTDYLLTYPDENALSAEQEAAFLKARHESGNEITILAEVNGTVVGLAGIGAIGKQEKIRHRADLGVSVDARYWHLGIGKALLGACIACAGNAGYDQLELTVVADNRVAIALYEKAGFTEFGRNPRGFKSRKGTYQEVVSMRLEL